MLSKATPLLLTASPTVTLHWSDVLLCIHFPYSLYPLQLITEVYKCSYLVLGQQHNRWTPKFSVLNKHFTHCRSYYREMNKATIRSSFLHTGERVNSCRYSISWMLCLYRQHWATTIRSRCASTPLALSVHWTATLVV